jgi:hypothetical protein
VSYAVSHPSRDAPLQFANPAGHASQAAPRQTFTVSLAQTVSLWYPLAVQIRRR